MPFLVTSISRMKPYSSSSAVCRALQHLGAGQSMSALVGVLDSGDPTDTLVLQQEIEAYQVGGRGGQAQVIVSVGYLLLLVPSASGEC